MNTNQCLPGTMMVLINDSTWLWKEEYINNNKINTADILICLVCPVASTTGEHKSCV